MALRFPWLPLVAAALVLTSVIATAEETVPGRPLLKAAVDERQMVTLEGNTRPEARLAANDRQAVADNLPLTHMHLQLKRSAAQERAVETYVNSLTDRASPNYHHWLSADEFGQRFGVAQSDINRITAWLKAKGLTVNLVYPSRMAIDFSGNAGQVSRAFNTEIHRLDVNGVSHFANVSDPRIPAALAPAVEGIVSLHDFHAHNKMVRRRAVAGGHPDDTGTCFDQPCYVVAPGDLATIYGLNALFSAGYSGQGEVIAVVEDTNLYSNSDWAKFRSTFGLTAAYPEGKLEVVHPAPKGGTACSSPSPSVNSDDGEAALDVEWASAAAPSATIMLASCNDTSTDGIYRATQNLVNSTTPPPVISISYGICEADDGATENASFNKLYQQAAAEGISVFVATGDGGPSDCEDSTANGTSDGIGINGWAATQYNVAVGGTDFRDTYDGTNKTYWSSSTGAPWSTAKSYVPEMPWDDTCANTMIAKYYGGTTLVYGSTGFCNTSQGASFRELGGGEGGPSGCYSGKASTDHVVSGTCKGYPKPSWQAGVKGIPSDKVRDIPDVSLFASDGSAWGHNYATCFTDKNNDGGPCTGNPVNWAGNAGGTSYATPIMAAIQALVDQYTKSTQGNPAPTYYTLAAAEYGASGNTGCEATKGKSIGSTCIFHDVTSGDTYEDCKGSIDCYRPSGTYGVLSTSSTTYRPAYSGGIGYDLATGLGSVNAYNLAKKWPH
jgi:subtilase family serine protease